MTLHNTGTRQRRASTADGFLQPLQGGARPAQRGSLHDVANGVLTAAARFWFGVAVIGQLLFVYYVASFYGGAIAQGNLAKWNKVLPQGYVPGDSLGNVAIGMHVLAAIAITAGGALQLVPQVRSRAPAFHRWNGRIYVLLAVASSIVGLYMVWVRGSVGGLVQHIGISVDAVLIVFCAGMAVRHARARNMAIHRRWALRLFMVVSAVWFFRVGLMFWIFLNKGPVGFDPDTFQGPFLNFLSFAQYLLPLAVLELYLRAQDRGGVIGRMAMATGLLALTIAMGIGIFAAAMFLWLPHT
jgi:uncharacterized membrane protein